MRQNADPLIINIYIYFKPGRIGFWGWPFSVMYPLWLLIVTLLRPERQLWIHLKWIFKWSILETWKKAREGQSLRGAVRNCALLKCLGCSKWNKTVFLFQRGSTVMYWPNCAVFYFATGNMKLMFSLDQRIIIVKHCCWWIKALDFWKLGYGIKMHWYSLSYNINVLMISLN